MKRLLILAALSGVIVLPSCDRKKAETTALSPAAPSYILARDDNSFPAGTRFIERLESTFTFPAEGANEQSIVVQHRDIRWELKTADHLVGEVLCDEMEIADSSRPFAAPPSAFLGIPIHFTRTDGKWKEEIPATPPLSPGERKELGLLAYDWSRGWNLNAYGTSARKVGDTWSTNDPAVFFNEPASQVSGVMNTTFKGVEDHQGRKCARLGVHFKFQGISDAAGALSSYELDGEILHALDELLDIEVRMKGTAELWKPGEDSTVPSRKAELEFRTTRELLR